MISPGLGNGGLGSGNNDQPVTRRRSAFAIFSWIPEVQQSSDTNREGSYVGTNVQADKDLPGSNMT